MFIMLLVTEIHSTLDFKCTSSNKFFYSYAMLVDYVLLFLDHEISNFFDHIVYFSLYHSFIFYFN